MNEEDKKLQKHLVDEMMKVSETNPDVMFYMEALMEYCLEKEKEVDKLNNIINEIKEVVDDYFAYDYKNESTARLDTINKINNIIVEKVEE